VPTTKDVHEIFPSIDKLQFNTLNCEAVQHDHNQSHRFSADVRGTVITAKVQTLQRKPFTRM
jgi:ribosomal protein L25 (general stress protein Ctc)